MVGKRSVLEEDKKESLSEQTIKLLKQINKYPPDPSPDFWETLKETINGPTGTDEEEYGYGDF